MPNEFPASRAATLTRGAELSPYAGACTTIVIFGGLANGLNHFPFEFKKAAAALPANKVFLRDASQCWYQEHVKRGLLFDLPEDDDHLVRQWLSSTRTVFMGNSMGGFAALLFGALMNASKVVAFAPQTFISPQLRLLHRESRWRQRTYRTYCRYGVFRRTYDVKPFLKTTPHVSADIYVGKNDHHDFIHAARLSPLSSVSIHQVDGAGHGVAKMLREIGELDLILRGLCETH